MLDSSLGHFTLFNVSNVVQKVLAHVNIVWLSTIFTLHFENLIHLQLIDVQCW